MYYICVYIKIHISYNIFTCFELPVFIVIVILVIFIIYMHAHTRIRSRGGGGVGGGVRGGQARWCHV